MAEIRLQIPDDIIDALRTKLRLGTNTDVVREALTLLNWAAGEKENGRYILSAMPDGKDIARLTMTSLENVEKKKVAA
jgi:hypothetical protein